MIAVDISCGYVDAPVNEGVDMVAEINRMKKEKNAVLFCDENSL